MSTFSAHKHLVIFLFYLLSAINIITIGFSSARAGNLYSDSFNSKMDEITGHASPVHAVTNTTSNPAEQQESGSQKIIWIEIASVGTNYAALTASFHFGDLTSLHAQNIAESFIGQKSSVDLGTLSLGDIKVRIVQGYSYTDGNPMEDPSKQLLRNIEARRFHFGDSGFFVSRNECLGYTFAGGNTLGFKPSNDGASVTFSIPIGAKKKE